MVVGKDVAVITEYKAGAGSGGGGGKAEVVGGDGGGDAHRGGHVLGVDLCGTHLLAGVNGGHIDDGAGPLPLQNLGTAAITGRG